ncbi:MAG: AMP-binding protein, partial [Clostridia bacterium]
MENETKNIAERLRLTRLYADITTEEMAKSAGVSTELYEKLEEGESDFSFTFLFKCASRLGMDISELVSGANPKLSFYNITRSGEGMPIKRREGFNYRHIAPFLKNRLSEPFIVTAKYDSALVAAPIALSTHIGQELDYIISGQMKVQLDDHIEILSAGDSVYYDSSHQHGMIAVGGDCVFLAVVFKSDRTNELPAEPEIVYPLKKSDSQPISKRYDGLIYHEFMDEKIDENGTLKDISFKIPDNFNFSYDVLDVLAKKCPNKRAMLWLSHDKHEIDFTFLQMAEFTNQTANYFISLGIKKGDRVMLVLKRHYQFWFSILALHKIGAIALPATSLLVRKDYSYRFDAAKVSAIVCTSDDDCPTQVDLAEQDINFKIKKIIVGCPRDGWSNFNTEIEHFSKDFERISTTKYDSSIMFFTSGTTGYPKIATHTATYPLGHIVTARWWHNVNPDGLHLTIA